MELNKEYINYLKSSGNGDVSLFLSKSSTPDILYFLENLGYLPKNFDGDLLVPLIKHQNSNIRFWTVKNLGKINSDKYINVLFSLAKNDTDTSVRREAVSSIGRLRNFKAKDNLINLLQDYDPKIVSQAIRGLLIFKNDLKVQLELKKLLEHPNEIIQSVIKKEFFSKIDNDNPTEKGTHTISPEYLKNIVVNGDVLDVLKYVPDESIHLTFTSPPYYNARDYSIYPSYQEYLLFLEKAFKEVHRITKEGRFFILNTSPIIIPRVSRSHSSKRYPIPFDIHPYLIKMGWEFIDDIVWLKPEASVKNRIAGFMQHRKPLAYKPNATTEYLMVYRKQTEKLLDWNMRQYDWEIVQESKVPEGYESSNVWKIDPTLFNQIRRVA
ncbi:MAG: restriction endonuclease subunit [Ignavibacteria bacterium]|nr:restriction endonuclease subunit [Ignavibacteria bacterium]